MSIHYENLDASVRSLMAMELQRDIDLKTLYLSPRLTEDGARLWPDILRTAFENYNDSWIASEIRSKGLMRAQETRRKPKGGFSLAQVPITAPDTLSEGEFNRYYARGVCLATINAGQTHVEIYRGKAVQSPRSESQAMIGKRILAESLLNDLRTSPGVEPSLGLPPGPNSGLTVKICAS